MVQTTGAEGRPTDRASAPPKRLHVVFALDTFEVGGTELNAIRTAERLDRSRVHVEFICLARRGPLLDRVRAGGFSVTEFPLRRLVGVGALRTGLRLRRWLRERKPDVFHAHDIYTNILGVPWARAAGVPLVIASRRWWVETNRRAHVWLNRLANRSAHRVLANSPAVARLVAAEGIPPARILTVPNFIESAAFVPPAVAQLSEWRREFAISAEDEVVGIVANLHAIKDIATLLRALARLAPTREHLRLIVVGDGSERDRLEEQARQLGVRDRVVFAGRRASQPSLHWLFDISVLSSRGEGFPNSVVEAMAAGRPVVATAVGGVPDAVKDGETGLLVPAGQDGALAGALAALLDDRARARRMGEAGVLRARREFGEDAVLHALVEAYVTALARRPT